MSTFAERKAQTLKRQGKTPQLASMNKSRASSGLTPLTGGEATSESTYIDKSTNSVVGRTSGKVLAVGTSLADALAKQNQVSGGSTPSVSGRPDLYGTTPLATEGQAYFDKSTQTTVTPKTVTPEQLKQVEQGTLESFNKAQGLTYLDGDTFEKLQPLLNESDLIRGPNGQISLKQGLSPEQVLAREATSVTGTSDGVSGITRTGDFNVDVPDAFSTDSISEFLDVPVTDTDFNTMMAEIKAQQDELLGLMVPGADEQATKAQILDIKNQVEKSLVELSMGLNNVEDQPIAMQFITGQQASIQRSAEAKLQNLARIETNLLNELGLEQEARQVQASVAQTKLGYLQTNLDTAFKVKAMVQADEDRIFARSQALSTSAQNTLSMVLESMQGMDETDMTSEQQKQLQDLAISAGIPYSLLTKGLENVKQQLMLKATEDSSDLLSLSEAESLGLPFGTTVSEASSLGLIPSSSKTKALSTEAVKLNAIVSSGLSSLSTIEEKLTENEGVFGRPLIASGTYKAAESNLKDSLGRLRSGGAITEDELNTYSKLLPERFDTQATVSYKLKELRKYLESAQSVSTDSVDSFLKSIDGRNDVDKLLDSLTSEQSFNTVSTDTNKGAETLDKVFSFDMGDKGGQCGHFVNQIAGTRMGDSIKSKLAYVNVPKTTAPIPGDIFVMPYRATGHTGFVIGSTPKSDGTFDVRVRDSNWGLDEKVKEHVINSSKLSGYARLS